MENGDDAMMCQVRQFSGWSTSRTERRDASIRGLGWTSNGRQGDREGGSGGGENGRLYVQDEREVVLLGRTGREEVKERKQSGEGRVTDCGCFGRGREIFGGALWQRLRMAGVAWESDEP